MASQRKMTQAIASAFVILVVEWFILIGVIVDLCVVVIIVVINTGIVVVAAVFVDTLRNKKSSADPSSQCLAIRFA